MTHSFIRTLALSFLVLPLLVLSGCSSELPDRMRVKEETCIWSIEYADGSDRLERIECPSEIKLL